MNKIAKQEKLTASKAVANSVSQRKENDGLVGGLQDNRSNVLSNVIQRVNYDDKPWCTSKLVSTTTTFDKRYYRKVKSHDEETDFLKDAVTAANGVTGHSSKDDYTETRGHVASEPTNASEI